MTKLARLALANIPTEFQYLLTDDYLGDRVIFRVRANTSEVLSWGALPSKSGAFVGWTPTDETIQALVE